MFKIGVISDTHIPTKCIKLPEEVFLHFKGVDLILHAGDFIDTSVLDILKEIAPLKAVYGNMDNEAVRKELPRKQIVKIGDIKIGLIHDLGSLSKIKNKIKEEFGNSKIDAVVFGHSHVPLNEIKCGILTFNPGSATDTIFNPYKSIGILTIDGKIEGKIIKLKNQE